MIEAAQKMKHLDVGVLPVCDGERLVGMITDRDITIRGIAEGCNPHLARVQQIMTRQISYCGEDQDVQEVAQLMEQKQIRRIPVLDRNKQLVGIVSLGDLGVRTHDEPLAGKVLERVSEKGQGAFATR
ncbi:MAG TPA: CBS domain-containing protein [Candidatus Sulfotelmatobacter sp.]|nr:CBS domain-containing protein [Candidatus Sulfotelmatobacter sp.]